MMKKFLRLFVLLFAVLAVPVAASALNGTDVNGDGEVTIADANTVIDAILGGAQSSNADVNGDGEVTIADVNTVIDAILGGSSVTPPGPGGLEGFSEETLETLKSYGFNINEGNDPPVINGVYAMEPITVIAQEGWGDWENATVMLKMIFNFKEQNGGKILFAGGSYQQDLETDEVYAEGDNEFMLVNINGQGNKFTVSYTIPSEDPGEPIWGGAIISGEKSNNGIKNLQIASIIFGMPMFGLNDLIFDIYGDSDGMSYPSEWPEWPEDDWSWIKSSGQDKVMPMMMSNPLKVLKAISGSTNSKQE